MQDQNSFKSNISIGRLYLVPTPIGNLDDMTFRAINILKSVDIIASEDTRNTKKLLNHFNIQNPQISFHEHNTQARIPELIAKLEDGKNLAQVSDAGMPSVSDPGHELVNACIKKNIPVIPLPGANAGITGLIASGLSPQPFYFYGFLDRKPKDQLNELKKLNKIHDTIIIYEAPHRLKKTLKNMSKVFGNDRLIVLCRELTKRYEEFKRGKLKEMINWSQNNSIKGEFVILIDGNHYVAQQNNEIDRLNNLSINQQVDYFIDQNIKTNHAIKKVAKLHNLKRQEVYNLYHKINV